MEIRIPKEVHIPPLTAKKSFLSGILFYLSAFLLSKCVLFGEIMPFGIALFAAQFVSAPPFLLGIIVVFASFIPLCLPAVSLKYALSLILFSLLVSKKGQAFLKSPAKKGGMMAASVFASGLFFLLGGQILLYDCFVLILEAGITWGFTCLFASAQKVLFERENPSAPLDILSVSAFFGVAALGLSSLFSLYGLYVTVSLSALAVLLLTYEGTVTTGAISGITLGVFTTLESGDPLLGAFSAAGLAAGYFSRLGRGGSVLSFLLAFFAVSFYTGGSTEATMHLYEISAPAVLFLALPPSVLKKLRKMGDNIEKGDAAAQFSLALREKAEAFSILSETFQAFSEDRFRQTCSAAANFFEKSARLACEGCPKLSFCWKKEFHRTYAAFFVMLEICRKKGALTKEDIPVSLEKKCIRATALPAILNGRYEIYKVDRLWEVRMQECRLLLSRQLSAVSHIFETLDSSVRSRTLSPSHPRLRIRYFGETVPKDGSSKSGDNYKALSLPNGETHLFLSDGMGSGERANAESAYALEILSTLFSAGFDTDTTISLTNSLLVLKSAEDSFATVDLCSLSFEKMEAAFIKIGGAASFLKRGRSIRKIEKGSLPMGVLPSADGNAVTIKIKEGDMIIMVSDGLCTLKKEQDTLWLENVAAAYRGDDPSELCRTLLEKARELSGGKIKDDMTVLCTLVEEGENFIA